MKKPGIVLKRGNGSNHPAAVFLVIVAAAFIAFSCKKSGSPAAPAPANPPPANTSTYTPTISPTFTESPTPTNAGWCGAAPGTCTHTATPTDSPTDSTTPTPSATLTATPSATPTDTLTITRTPTVTNTFTVYCTVTVTAVEIIPLEPNQPIAFPMDLFMLDPAGLWITGWVDAAGDSEDYYRFTVPATGYYTFYLDCWSTMSPGTTFLMRFYDNGGALIGEAPVARLQEYVLYAVTMQNYHVGILAAVGSGGYQLKMTGYSAAAPSPTATFTAPSTSTATPPPPPPGTSTPTSTRTASRTPMGSMTPSASLTTSPMPTRTPAATLGPMGSHCTQTPIVYFGGYYMDGTAYAGKDSSVTFTPLVAGGVPPYHYVTADLSDPPLGMWVGSDGTLSGNPVNPGRYVFSLCVVDDAGCYLCSPVTVDVLRLDYSLTSGLSRTVYETDPVVLYQSDISVTLTGTAGGPEGTTLYVPQASHDFSYASCAADWWFSSDWTHTSPCEIGRTGGQGETSAFVYRFSDSLIGTGNTPVTYNYRLCTESDFSDYTCTNMGVTLTY